MTNFQVTKQWLSVFLFVCLFFRFYLARWLYTACHWSGTLKHPQSPQQTPWHLCVWSIWHRKVSLLWYFCMVGFKESFQMMGNWSWVKCLAKTALCVTIRKQLYNSTWSWWENSGQNGLKLWPFLLIIIRLRKYYDLLLLVWVSEIQTSGLLSVHVLSSLRSASLRLAFKGRLVQQLFHRKHFVLTPYWSKPITTKQKKELNEILVN